jgi:hypothetical protein
MPCDALARVNATIATPTLVAELLALGATPRSGASVGIGETIDVSTYRRAREALSCETPVVTPAHGRSTRVQTPTTEGAAPLL